MLPSFFYLWKTQRNNNSDIPIKLRNSWIPERKDFRLYKIIGCTWVLLFQSFQQMHRGDETFLKTRDISLHVRLLWSSIVGHFIRGGTERSFSDTTLELERYYFRLVGNFNLQLTQSVRAVEDEMGLPRTNVWRYTFNGSFWASGVLNVPRAQSFPTPS